MIELIYREELNVKAYDACVHANEDSRVYATSWFLDIVCDQWAVLVLEDYQAVMPLPIQKKYGLRYISQPYFCQQLGIFSREKLSKKLILEFLQKIPRKFIKLHLNVNFSLGNKNYIKKLNYQLSLNKPYEELQEAYRKDRKKDLKKAKDAGLIYQDFDNRQMLLSMYKEVFGHVYKRNELYETIERIMNKSLSSRDGFIRNVYVNDALISSGFFLQYQQRIYYLFAATCDQGKKYGATTFLINSVIKQFANSNVIFDFEGSSIESIGSFYKSFGSSKTTYYQINRKIREQLFS